ncbi:MAG: hypothetical protein PHR06_09680 [Candidatus Cloacimonetes bacterium]|nr:hypothetical protein [Candidatus Cloacimonadota bacterium]
MKYNELEIKKMMKKGSDNLSVDELISIDILNFIRTVYLNKQEFYSARFDTQYFGDREMMFKKEANCLIGHCRVSFKDEGKVIDYLFTENGYELLSEIYKTE